MKPPPRAPRRCPSLSRPSLLLALAFLLLAARAAAAEHPSVLFLMADDLRSETEGSGWSPVTPHLDRLAAMSVSFDRAYCQQAVCNPSRSSLLTGLRPDTLGLWNNGTHFRELQPDVVTLPQWFKLHGYQARCAGKIFHNWHTETRGDPRSWSAPEFLHYEHHGHDAPLVPGALPPNLLSEPSLRDYGQVPLCERREVPDEAYFDGRVADEAVRVLGEIKDRPFFLAAGFWKPHAPFTAPKKYWDLYDREALPPLRTEPPEGAPDLAFHDSREVLGLGEEKRQPTAAQAAEMRHGYFAAISYFDAQLGKVLDALEESGAAERTVIVFASDHGYHLGERGLWGKTSCFELDARVPLMISPPDRRHGGRRTQALAELVDLYPTLAQLCGLPLPEDVDGVSLVPVLEDPGSGGIKPAAFTQHPRPAYFDREPAGVPLAMGYSARTSAVRYTEWRDWQSGEVLERELYDAVRDPGETRNAIGDPALAPEQAAAEALLREQFPREAPQ